jgi:hypothetical protein
MPSDNPYLAHHNKPQKSAGTPNGYSSNNDPLYGFIPRKVKAPAVEKALVRMHLILNKSHLKGD